MMLMINFETKVNTWFSDYESGIRTRSAVFSDLFNLAQEISAASIYAMVPPDHKGWFTKRLKSMKSRGNENIIHIASSTRHRNSARVNHADIEKMNAAYDRLFEFGRQI